MKFYSLLSLLNPLFAKRIDTHRLSARYMIHTPRVDSCWRLRGLMVSKGSSDMRIRTAKVAVLLAAWFAVLACGRAGLADEAVSSEKRLPKNVLAYVSLRNVADFKAQWAKSLFGQLERDEALVDFRSEIEKQFAESSKQLEDQLGLSLAELLSIPHGEIAAAAVVGLGGKISAVVFLDFGEREEAVQKLLVKASDALENDGAKRNEEEIEDTKVIVFQKVPDEGDQKPQDAA